MMNKTELKQVLSRNNIPEWYYNIDGYGNTDQKICMEEEEGRWKVYYTERGKVSRLTYYDSESDACKGVLKLFYIIE
ncbi:MAG: hypothetical protein NC120_10290 [Ruminococcus sp.]|nr:hypothetical protein [Ruminococcus sp.]